MDVSIDGLIRRLALGCHAITVTSSHSISILTWMGHLSTCQALYAHLSLVQNSVCYISILWHVIKYVNERKKASSLIGIVSSGV